MKKRVLIILIFSLFTFLCSGEAVLQIDDPLDDDYGDGRVTYPEHAMFTPGIFDIEQFRIEKNGDNYDFVIRVRGKVKYVNFDEYEYRYDIPEDFIFPMIQIYIDTDHQINSGNTELIAGVNAVLSPETAWEKAVVISAMPQRFRLRLNNFQPALSNRIDIPPKIYLSRDKKEMRVRIDRSFLGDIKPDWGYTILMLAHDVTSTVKKNVFTMEVKSTSSLFTFGGGHGALLKRYNSNIIDLIVPRFKSQKKILGNYSAENKKIPEIEAIYPYSSSLKKEVNTGEVKQVSEEKVVINLGSDQGVEKGTKLIIENQYVVEVKDVFPGLSIADFTSETEISEIKEGMKARIWQE